MGKFVLTLKVKEPGVEEEGVCGGLELLALAAHDIGEVEPGERAKAREAAVAGEEGGAAARGDGERALEHPRRRIGGGGDEEGRGLLFWGRCFGV
jgi:hypothetical protein